MKLAGITRKIVLRNVLPGVILPCLFIPARLLPTIPTSVVWASLGLTFSWLGVVVGGFWMELPEQISSFVAPLWLALSVVLERLHVPGFRG